MIAHDPFVAVFGSVPPGDEEMLIKVVANAVRNGFAIVLDKPGTKEPLCILNTRDRKRANDEAREAARSIGDPRWEKRKHPCGVHHALTVESLGGDPKTVLTKAGNIIRRVTKEYGGTPNIGVDVGRSKMLVVDVDTQSELDGFRTWWQKQTTDSVPGLTVRSPGVMEADGTWVHKDGGHCWFTVPAGVTLPEGVGTYRAPSGWVAMWSGKQVLVPPSSRPEGDYLLVGQLNEAPGFLTDELVLAAVARMERASARTELPDGTGDIDRWAASLPWGDLLELDGWIDTGLPDRCSCPIWTAPGPHGSPKSATAHDVGCDRYDAGVGHAPLHVWTDNPPAFLDDAYRATGSRTLTKLQYVAWRDHAGDTVAALAGIGLGTGASVEGVSFDVPEEWTTAVAPSTPPTKEDMARLREKFEQRTTERDPFPPCPTGVACLGCRLCHAAREAWDERHPDAGHEPFTAASAADVDEDEDPSPAGDNPVESRSDLGRVLGSLLDANDLDSIPDPEPLITGVLDVNTVAVLVGKFGTYKTFLALSWAACVATGKPWQGHEVPEAVPVLYVAAEGASGLKMRMRAWTKTHGGLPKGMLHVIPVAAKINDVDEIRQLDEAIRVTGAKLLVLDTLHKVTPGMDENSSKDMGEMLHLVGRLRERHNLTVLLVHHTGHNGAHERGSSSLGDGVDTSFLIKLGGDGEDRRAEVSRTLVHRKAKDARTLDPLDLRLVEVDGTGSCVVDADPFDRTPATGTAVSGTSSPELESRVLDALDGTLGKVGLATPAVLELVGGRKANLLTALTELCKSGAVVATLDGRTKRWAITESGNQEDVS